MPEVDIKDQLWSAVLDKVKEIESTEGRAGSRSAAYYTKDGRSCLSVMDVGHQDGTHAVFLVKANIGPIPGRAPSVDVQRAFHNAEPYWEMQLSDRDGAIVIDGTHYRIRSERNAGPPTVRGFSGRRFVVEDLATGERTVTTNLWYQGPIPPVFRDRLPDTHRFVEEADRG